MAGPAMHLYLRKVPGDPETVQAVVSGPEDEALDMILLHKPRWCAYLHVTYVPKLNEFVSVAYTYDELAAFRKERDLEAGGMPGSPE